MNGFAGLIVSVEAGWTWLYTAGMGADVAGRRREEVACHGYEFLSWARHCQAGPAAAIHALAAFVLGIPADIGWRLSVGRAAVSRDAWQEGAIALLIAAGALFAVPIAVLLALAYSRIDGEPGTGLQMLTSLHLIVSLLALAAPGLLAMGARPVAGTTLVVLGALSAMLTLWWLPELAAAAGAGAVAAVASSWRAMRAS